MQVFLLKKYVLVSFQTMKKKNQKLQGITAGCETLGEVPPIFLERGLFNIQKFQCGGTKKRGCVQEIC